MGSADSVITWLPLRNIREMGDTVSRMLLFDVMGMPIGWKHTVPQWVDGMLSTLPILHNVGVGYGMSTDRRHSAVKRKNQYTENETRRIAYVLIWWSLMSLDNEVLWCTKVHMLPHHQLRVQWKALHYIPKCNFTCDMIFVFSFTVLGENILGLSSS